jgi:predicted DNA-binding transcriptional regulator AlpA
MFCKREESQMESTNTARRLLTVHDLQLMGFSRGTAYSMLNRADLPVIRIGQRKFMHAELFEEWLRKQAEDPDARGI